MFIITLLPLLFFTPSVANVIGRQVLISECDDGHVVAPANSAISNLCGASTASNLSGSLTSQSFWSSNSTTISYSHTTATNSLPFASSGNFLSSTQSSLFSPYPSLWSSTGKSGFYQTSTEVDLSSSLSSPSSQSSQLISTYNSFTDYGNLLTSTTRSLGSPPIKTLLTLSTSTTTQSEAFNQSPTPSGSSLSVSARSPQSSYRASVTLSLTTKSDDVFGQPAAVGSKRTVLSSTSVEITSSPRSIASSSSSNAGRPLSSFASQTDTPTSMTPPPSVSGSNQSISAISLGDWPATITFCTETNGRPAIGYGFVTDYSGGSSSVTNTIPSQALISTSPGLACAGEVVVTKNGLVTSIELSTLPSATSLSQLTAAPGVQVVTRNGRPVIDHVPCGDVEIGLGFFVHLLLGGCSGHTGFLGWPGGPIIGGSPPPFPGDASGEDPGKGGDDGPEETPTASDEQSMTKTESGEQSSAISSTQSLTSATRSSASSTQASASKIEYFIVASPHADQGEIRVKLRLFDPAKGGTYEPDVGETSVSGGTWIDYQLDSNQSAIIASRTDIILVMESTTVSGFEAASGATTLFTNVPSAVSFDTVSAEPTASSLGLVNSKDRGDHRNLVADDQTVNSSIRRRGSREAEATVVSRARNGRSKRFGQEKSLIEMKGLQKRDSGTRLVRQVRQNMGGLTGDKYPSDLAVMSWAPGVSSIGAGKVDYMFEESRGENTWVYVVDSGVAKNNLEFTTNWNNGPLDANPQSNIDANWIFTPGASTKKDDKLGHGTCMTSKVCGKRSGVAKQATIIPVVLKVDDEGEFAIDSVVTAAQLVLADIGTRRSSNPPSALEKKTVMMMAISIDIEEQEQRYVDSLSAALQAIMDLGVIVAVAAGNNAYQYGEGFVAQTYPAALALSRLPSLIRVGAVDQNGMRPQWAQQGDVYACGVGVLCATLHSFSFREDAEGSSAALAVFAGLVAYEMGSSSVPYNFGEDPKQYQSIVKEYYVNGAGSWRRPGSNVKTVWNGLDGSAKTYCPLNQRKRDVSVDDTCDRSSLLSSDYPTSTSSVAFTSTFSIPSVSTFSVPSISTSIVPFISTASVPPILTSSRYSISISGVPSLSTSSETSASTFSVPSVSTSSTMPVTQAPLQYAIAIYYSQETGCRKSGCVRADHIYPGLEPWSICEGDIARAQGSSQESIGFQLPSYSGPLNFTYSRTSDKAAGEVTGPSLLSTPVTCVAAPSPTPSRVCKPGQLDKRAVGPIGVWPVTYTYYEWASCVWSIP